MCRSALLGGTFSAALKDAPSRLALLGVFLGVWAVLAIGPASAAAGVRNLLTGFGDQRYQGLYSPVEQSDALEKTRNVNGDVVRLSVNWRAIAPASQSAAFDATDPGSSQYDWRQIDGEIANASAHELRVMLLVQVAPRWAEGGNRPSSAAQGTWKPNPQDLADFGTALARRYSGSYAGLPEVRDYMVWGEANLETNLTPVWKGKSGKKPAAPVHYRKMLNAFYDAVHGVDESNRVITAGTAPYGADPGVLNMRPLLFWRTILCVKDNRRLSPKAKCTRPKFDVLAHNPINTSGGPGRSAIDRDDVSTPDLHNLVDVLRAAEKAGNVKPGGQHPVWATELWWESNPPDPYSGNPSLKRQAVWYTQSLYSLWRQGASMVLLLQVQDAAYDGTPGRFNDNLQSGVFQANGSAKPAAAALRFPFVADRRSKRKVILWGVAPTRGKLVVREKGRTGTISRLSVKADKVFETTVKLSSGSGKHMLRAKVGGQKSPYWVVK